MQTLNLTRIWPPDYSKLDKNPINDNDVTIFQHDVNVNFFWHCFVSLVKVSYWSTFHVNIISASGIMTIFFYKGLTRNPEIGNTPVWVLPNIWRLGRVMDTKFGTNVFNRMLLNAAKFQGYSFNRFWVIKGKPTGGWEVKLRPPTQPPRLGLRRQKMCLNLISFKNFSKYDMKNRAHTFCLVQKKNSFDLKICQICQIDKTMKNLHWIPNTIVSTSMLALFWSFHFWWCQNWFI